MPEYTVDIESMTVGELEAVLGRIHNKNARIALRHPRSSQLIGFNGVVVESDKMVRPAENWQEADRTNRFIASNPTVPQDRILLNGK